DWRRGCPPFAFLLLPSLYHFPTQSAHFLNRACFTLPPPSVYIRLFDMDTDGGRQNARDQPIKRVRGKEREARKGQVRGAIARRGRSLSSGHQEPEQRLQSELDISL